MSRTLLLFGPSDRHNLGDLLFPQVVAALCAPRRLEHVGLAERDLQPLGGVAVRPLGEVLADEPGADAGHGAGGRAPRALAVPGPAAPALVHIGGEILTCPAWHAAVMLMPPAEVPATVAWLEREPAVREAWLRERLGTPGGRLQRAPYVASRLEWPPLGPVVFNAVGGVDLDAAEPALREEVIAKLRAADLVTVRDTRTLGHLRAAGVEATLLPDGAVMVAELFGPVIERHAAASEPAAVRAAMPQGYVALQFGPEFVDDASLHAIAAAVTEVAREAGLGVVLFRAGAAPWHDDLHALRRCAAFMVPVGEARAVLARAAAVGEGVGDTSPLPPATGAVPVRVFESLHLWDVCALLAHCRAFVGSSLHGLIVAAAFARPRVGLCAPPAPGRPGKQAAYAQTWEPAAVRTAVVEPDSLVPALRAALAAEERGLRAVAEAQVTRYRAGFEALTRVLDR